MLDRRRNPNDPVAHPSLFFRRRDELNDLVSRNMSQQITVSAHASTQTAKPVQSPLELARSVYQKECSVLSARSNQTTMHEFSISSSNKNSKVRVLSNSTILAPQPPSMTPRPKTTKSTTKRNRVIAVDKLFRI